HHVGNADTAKGKAQDGNLGFGCQACKQFAEIIEMAIRYEKPVRIGVNWGSLDQNLLTALMDQNAEAGSPLSARQVTRE
ncbi:flavodoxin-dependent (E)-4-hydroxy-3-methylbut-2-enyl-diphosphate synthase, partial [Rhizobium ruizarguesonis]